MGEMRVNMKQNENLKLRSLKKGNLPQRRKFKEGSFIPSFRFTFITS